MRAMNELSNPDVATAATAAASGLLGAGIGQRAVAPSATRGERAGYFFGSWACSPLFGPFVASKLGMAHDLYAVAAVCGACAVVGLVVVDATIRYLRTSGGFVALARRLFAAFFPGSGEK
jgi:hypothetical protein